MKKIAFLTVLFCSLLVMGEEAFTQPFKLMGEKGEKPVFTLNELEGSGQSRVVRASGKAWSSVQITHEGEGVRLKKEMNQVLTGSLPLESSSFSCSVWMRPVTIEKPYSMVLANTTRPPCWGVRLYQVEPEGSFRSEIFYNWNIPNVPGKLLASKTTYQIGKWYFYTLTFDRESQILRFYIDGEQVGTAELPKETPAFRNMLTVSSNPWYFDGQIYALTFYPKVLSPEQIAARFQEGSSLLKEEQNEK